MRNPYELFAGLRYTRAKRRNHFISFISLASMLGIAIGVTALITVLSVMNGFEKELRVRILGMVSALRGGLEDWQGVAKLAEKNPEIMALAPYVEGEGMVKAGSDLTGTLLRGVLPEEEQKVSEIAEKMKVGQLSDLKAGEYRMVLGKELATTLGVDVGDKVDLMIPQASVTPAGVLPRFRRFTVSGVFQVGMYEFDRGLVLIHMADAQALYRMGSDVTGVRLKLHDLFKAPQVSRELAGDLPGIYYVSDWTRQHANFFRAVRTEKMVMFIILSLIVGVAAFNIVSTLVMVVQDKQADIAILRTLGATPRSIMLIFMVQGSIIGIVGTVLGIIGGVLLAVNVYYISDLPSDLKLEDVVKIGLLSLTLGLLSTLYPAYRASRTQPAEALRYE